MKKKGGTVVHYAFGAVMGAVYGAAAEVAPPVKSLAGLPYGAALFVGADEIALPPSVSRRSQRNIHSQGICPASASISYMVRLSSWCAAACARQSRLLSMHCGAADPEQGI